MQDAKPFWQSKTLAGVLLLLLPHLLAKWGLTLNDADQQQLVDFAMEAIGSLLAIVGRITAQHRLTTGGSSSGVPGWVLLIGAAAAVLLSGCAATSPGMHLPRGSYAEAGGFAKDTGGKAAVGGRILVHVPLDGGLAK